jgi:crossover junction endodeoxyribonuclease RusA
LLNLTPQGIWAPTKAIKPEGVRMVGEWTGRGKVRAREITGGVEIAIDGITTQARYYKPLVYEFFRKDFPIRPKGGEFEVELIMEYVGEVPRLDLDNLAKALLDALKGHVFFDDSQIAKLLCQRRAGERERITVTAVRRNADD